MADNRYELRSNEVQEVMNRPPNFFIGWGNTIIISLLIAGIIAINGISLQLKETIPAVLTQAPASAASWTLTLNAAPSAVVRSGNDVKITVNGMNREKSGALPGKIDSTWVSGHTPRMSVSLNTTGGKLLTTAGTEITPAAGMPVVLEIATGKAQAVPYFIRKLLYQ
jgi:hypothetical protein